MEPSVPPERWETSKLAFNYSFISLQWSSLKRGNNEKYWNGLKCHWWLVWTFFLTFLSLFSNAVFSPVFVIFLVVLQGPLHLEVQPAASGPRRELGLLVRFRFLLQDMWRWSPLPQQTMQQPTVSSAEKENALKRNQLRFRGPNSLYAPGTFIQQMVACC